MENWKPLKINELFEISDFGRVRRKLVHRAPYMYYKCDIGKAGYLRVMVFFKPNSNICYWGDNESTKKRFLVHRLVAEHFIPNPENKPQVNHIDGNPSNNRLSNLEWVTVGENLEHAYRIGRASKVGSKNSIAKLTDEKVIKIRELKASTKLFDREIGEMFGVTQSLVSMVVNRKIWNHV